MGLFEFFRRRPEAVHRTWTHAKDVAIFADADAGPQLERALAREGIQARVFRGPEGRAIEIMTRFLPGVLLVRADQVDIPDLLTQCSKIPGLAEVPLLLCAVETEALGGHLGERAGAVLTSVEPDTVSQAVAAYAPELLE